jgi:FkbM family methyltransferase
MLSGIPGDLITVFEHDGVGWEPHIGAMIAQIVPKGGGCIDVGANIGVHTIAMAKAVGDAGYVQAIEPQQCALVHLARNISSFHNITVHVALAGGAQTPSMRMCAPVPRNMGATSADFSGTAGVGELLPIVTIDYLSRGKRAVNFIKVDVEGMEMEVLLGAVETIRRCRPIMLIEIQEGCLKRGGSSSAEVMRWLLGQGYVLYRIRASERRLTFFADHLCVPIELDGSKDWAATTGYPCDRLCGHGTVVCSFTPDVEHAYTTAIIEPDTTLAVHVMCYNEEALLPLFVSYYRAAVPNCIIYVHDNDSSDDSRAVARALGCIVVPLRTSGLFDEYALTECRAACWHGDKCASTWVLVCDMDEFVTVSSMFLQAHVHATCIAATGYQMIGNGPSAAWPTSITLGYHNAHYCKALLFKRAMFKAVNFSLGSHQTAFIPYMSTSAVKAATTTELQLFHFHYLSESYAYRRLSGRRKRFSSRMPSCIDVQSLRGNSVKAVSDVMKEHRALCSSIAAAATLFDCIPPPTFSVDWAAATREILQRLANGEFWEGGKAPHAEYVVEIGAFEGRTSVELAKTFAHATIVCIDPWRDGCYSPAVPIDLTGQYGRFLRNTCRLRDRLVVKRGSSADVLKAWDRSWLIQFALIDGDHSSSAVYADAESIWPFIVEGGLMLFDDFEWAPPGVTRDQCPKLGISRWMHDHAADALVLHVGDQVLVRKHEKAGR